MVLMKESVHVRPQLFELSSMQSKGKSHVETVSKASMILVEKHNCLPRYVYNLLQKALHYNFLSEVEITKSTHIYIYILTVIQLI